MQIQAESVLVKYFRELQLDSDTPYPNELGGMNKSGINFEISKLYEFISMNTRCRNPFIMDVPEVEILNLTNNRDDDIRVSALLSIISQRLPQLQLSSRVG